MVRRLQIFPEKCIGCRSCELACSFEKENEFKPSRSRISTLVSQDGSGTVCFPIVCFQCEDAPCAEACQFGAIKIEKDSKVVKVSEEDCTGCGQCVSACPFGGMLFDQGDERAKKCDLCEGKPACVDFCPTQAIQYSERKESFWGKKALPSRFCVILSNFRTKDLING